MYKYIVIKTYGKAPVAYTDLAQGQAMW